MSNFAVIATGFLRIKILRTTYNATVIGESPFDAEDVALRS
ncbi:hypothetical protein [Rhizobium leguminosarum]|nr:hypothetical protein [Rhizobium leguminosarum]MBP2445402.1 hypothetical protein [Rhizobium leguminosarum]